MKLKKGDTVVVTAGKDRGKSGKIVRVLSDKSAVVVEGVHVHKKHQRPTKQNQKGQIIDVTMPIHISNVQIVDPKDGKPTRVGFSVTDGKKQRIAKRSGSAL